jgi:hypothetical protein
MEFFEDWKFIANIPKGAKPCYYDKSLIYINEWFPTLRRRWKGEKGEKGVMYVENLLETSTKTISCLDIHALRNFKEILQSSLVGLRNLVYTYKVDEQISVSNSYHQLSTDVEKLIEEIDTQIRNKSNFFSYVPKIIN